ncbi:MAG: acetyl-CoA carboxylase biotin carboxyl carrier protein [Flavobacteriales bacterium]|jgi:acetyl-CoA carboxylase biotin carboxyl carrier protein
MNLTEIQDLIKFVAKQKVTEVEIEKKDFKIIIKSEKEEVHIAHVSAPAPLQMAIPTAPISTATPAAPANEAVEESNYITIKSPMIGTFYRSSSPETDSFVNVGDIIKEGDVLCIIEAMKLKQK